MSVTRAAQPPGAAARAFTYGGGLLFAASLAYFAWFYLEGLARRSASLPAAPAMAVDTILFALFAAHHSVFARAPLRAWVAAHVSPSLERTVYVWLASIAFAATCALWQPFGSPLWQIDGMARLACRALQTAGLLLTLKAAGALDPLSLAGVRQLDAPLPASGVESSASPLRVSGLYGLVRHPIYFAWLLIVWPAPTMTPAHALFAAVSSAYLVIAVIFEERSLHETYGTAYADYARRVPHKLIPWVF